MQVVPDSAAEVARRYAEAINRQDVDAVMELFADDAVWMGQLAPPTAGKASITDLYRRLLERKPDVRLGRQISEGNQSVIELERFDRATGERRIVALDHFMLDTAGKIERIHVYAPPKTNA